MACPACGRYGGNNHHACINNLLSNNDDLRARLARITKALEFARAALPCSIHPEHSMVCSCGNCMMDSRINAILAGEEDGT